MNMSPKDALLWLLLALPLSAQTFFGAGLSALPASKPGLSPFAFIATPISMKQDVWSITEANYSWDRQSRRVLTTLSANAASPLRQFGPKVALWALLGPGVATTGSTTSAALNVGAFLKVDLRHGSLIPGWRRIVSGASPTVDQFVIAYGWGR